MILDECLDVARRAHDLNERRDAFYRTRPSRQEMKVFREVLVGPIFFSRRADDALLDLAAATDPDNPFLVGAYMRAQRALGLDAWIVGEETRGTLRSAALGVIKSGRIRRSLFINSLPSFPSDSDFWRGLEDFCAEHGITDLELATRASPESIIPPIRGELERIGRAEFVLRLAGRDIHAGMSNHHRARVRKGTKRGLTIRVSRNSVALDAHIALHMHSMLRREARGEEVPLEFARVGPLAYLEAGAGSLYQAILRDEVVSSLMILRSATGAYFESGGSSSEGMRIGASHFLLFQTAVSLQAEGVETFFLGGARPSEEGLRAYKAGFGAVPVDTESVSAYVGGRLRRRVSAAVESIQNAIKAGKHG
jgi:Acetyltransferase (GNAT) domain